MSKTCNGRKIASEDDALNVIDSFFPRSHKDMLLGRGDDCAEFRVDSPLALSTDLFLEDVHFRRSYFSPEDAGWKALAVNLSDLASAGARPVGFSLGLMCPPDLERGWLEGLFKGMSELAACYGLPLVGGDISSAPMLGISITVWGASWFSKDSCLDMPDVFPKGLNGESFVVPFIRRGAEAGDIIFALSPGKAETGSFVQDLFDGQTSGRALSAVPEEPCILGLAAAGLDLLERDGRGGMDAFPSVCAALLRPKPLLAAGRALTLAARVRGARVHAMDLSDGLQRDLPRLLNGKARNAGVFPASGEGRGAELDFAVESLHPELLRYAAASVDGADAMARAGGVDGSASVLELSAQAQRKALEFALRGGDEYALLCACPVHDFENIAEALASFAPGTGLKTLGRVSAIPGVRWHGTELESLLADGGFDHFSGASTGSGASK